MSFARGILAFCLYGVYLYIYTAGRLPETLTRIPVILELITVLGLIGVLYALFSPFSGKGNWG